MAHNDPLCIYHGGCRDGFASAWVVKRRFPNADFFEGFYGQAPPDVSGREVVMVDFSYSRDVLEGMADEATSILILDHHKTAEAALKDFTRYNVRILFDMNRSGAGLTWDYYYGPRPRPWMVNYVEDRDLWRHQLHDSKKLNAWLGILPFSFDLWDNAEHMKLDQAASLGETVLTKVAQYVMEAVKNVRIVNFQGHVVPCVNAPQVDISELLNHICLSYPHTPFAVGWWQRSDGIFQFSLRSTGAFDVSDLAKANGGGGHKAAAGFQRNTLPDALHPVAIAA